MSQYIIQGKEKLKGEINISGAKNAAVAVLPAALLLDGQCKIENVPDVADVRSFLDVIVKLGVEYSWDKDCLTMDSSKMNSNKAIFSELGTMRASYYLLGAFIGKFKEGEVTTPGGCDFGYRPIDQHIKGFEALGIDITDEGSLIKAKANKMQGTQIYLDIVSVGATINLMLAACKIPGTTIIENAAKEPHIVDVANFLNVMGAEIRGAGTDTIRINGVTSLPGGKTYTIIPDQIEAGTYMIAAGATNGDITVRNIIPKHMESLSAKLIEMNIGIQSGDDWIRVIGNEIMNGTDIRTQPYPGFPTDLHPQMASLLCLTHDTSTIIESIWDKRFSYIDQLRKMKGKVKVVGNKAIIKGTGELFGATVKANDLRAGAAMVIAALAAEGETKINQIEYIDRGYEKLGEKLVSVGAKITRRE